MAATAVASMVVVMAEAALAAYMAEARAAA